MVILHPSTVFAYAIIEYCYNKEAIDYIFNFCADIHQKSHLHYAVERENKYAIKFLLDKGIDDDIRDIFGN